MEFLDNLVVAVLIALRIMLIGMVWTAQPRAHPSHGIEMFRCGAMALALGVVLNLLPALILSPVNYWSPILDWTAWSVLVLLGIVRLHRKGVGLRNVLSATSVSVTVLALMSAFVLMMPPRSEWLAGGWDPGIYQGNAVRIAVDNGIRTRTNTIYAVLSPEEITRLSRGSAVYREILPSVPIDRDDGSIPLYSFHLTPLLGAWLYRLGGMETLVRLPSLVGFWLLWVAWGLFDRLGANGWRAAVIALVVALSPLWWYHQAIPTTEMLYTFLLVGGLMFFVSTSSVFPMSAGLLLFAATVNHFNFPVVWALLSTVFAVTGWFGFERQQLFKRLLFCMIAVSCGILWDILFASITVVRLQEKDQILGWVLGPFFILGLLALGAAWKPLPARLQDLAIRIGFIVLAGLMLVPLTFSILMHQELWYIRIANIPVFGMISYRLARFHYFMGVPQLLWTAWGVYLLAADRNPERRSLRILVLALSGVFIAFLLNPGIAEIYPWGLRRYIVVMLPLMAICQSVTIIRWDEKRGNRSIFFNALILGLFFILIGSSLRHSWAAARVGDYVGLRQALEEINQRIDLKDIVVVDDPRWGTPLALIYGRDVVNGQFLWRSEDVEYRADFIATLRRLEQEYHRRVVWITTTESGLGIYSFDPQLCSRMGDPISFSYKNVVHSKRANRFATSENHRTFQFFTCPL